MYRVSHFKSCVSTLSNLWTYLTTSLKNPNDILSSKKVIANGNGEIDKLGIYIIRLYEGSQTYHTFNYLRSYRQQSAQKIKLVLNKLVIVIVVLY